MFTSLALLVVTQSPQHTCGSCGDWRANLPAAVTKAVARVDANDFWFDPGAPPASAPASPAAPLVLGETPDEKRRREAHERDVKADIELGKKYAAEIDKELKPSEDKAMIDRVQKIGQEIAKIANETQVNVLWGDKRLSRFEYTFKVVKGDDVNAFSIPGGFIYVYEGLVKFAESDDELASVMAHEVAHASFRHLATLRRESDKVSWIQLPLLIVAALSRNSDSMNALMAAQLTNQALSSGWSVQAEEAADYGSVQYMLRSNYNPVGGLTFMERLGHREELRGKLDWGIYRTHPPSEERARAIQARLRQAGLEIRRSKVSTSFAAQTKTLEDGAIQVRFGSTIIHTFRGDKAAERAKAAQDRLNGFFDTVPQVFMVDSEGNLVKGAGQKLFEITPEDGQDVVALSRQATNRMKTATFRLAERVWSAGTGR